ncbi:DUF1015 domain-containing protein [Streptomyces sp. NPDC057638]|uniref:DUF1015 domain-containing protein n=1 Tax=Streptomyces sp. NPDC057638 TaxID=3346190 RepID=UPI0036AC0A69
MPASLPGPVLRPFRAVRYAPALAGDLSQVVCPPYDAMNHAHAHALRRRPHHLARLLYSARPRDAALQLTRWTERGVLVRDERPALYVYEQRLAQRTLQRGLIGELDLTHPRVLPHEGVREHVVHQRAAQLAGMRAQLEPLLLAHRPSPNAPDGAALMATVARRRPLVIARVGRVAHLLWACDDPAEQSVLAAHAAGGSALVADGHHRRAACLHLAARPAQDHWTSGLALLVDQDTHPLRLAAIHRVIPSLDPEKAAASAADVARVRPLRAPRLPAPGEIVLTGSGRAWSLDTPSPTALAAALRDHPPQWATLPTAVADLLLLRDTWSVPDLPGAVHHVHDAPLATASVATPGQGTAVLLPPLPEPEVRTLAASGVLLPHKTTSFGPKPVAGLVLRVPE